MSRERFLVTDLTRMHGASICIAGYVKRHEGYVCVRPVLPWSSRTKGQIPEDILHSSDQSIGPFTIIELNFYAGESDPPHIEDEVFSGEILGVERRLGLQRREEFLRAQLDASLESIFDGKLQRSDSGDMWVPYGAFCRSLGTIEVSDIKIYIDPRKDTGTGPRFRMRFTDSSAMQHWLTFTDLAARRFLQSLIRDQGMDVSDAAKHLQARLRSADAVFLRIGLARPREYHPDRCALLLTGIYSFPDYLDGRTHADFPRDYA